MYDIRPVLKNAATLQRANFVYFQMAIAAQEVFWRRMIQMARGEITSLEATRMFFEKPATFAKGAEKAAMASAYGRE
jgi:hypothetical protein